MRKIPIYRLYRAKSEESEDFWLHSETIPARSQLHNWEISIHRHEALSQLFIVREGAGEMLDKNAVPTAFSSPCMLYIAPGAGHGFRFSHDVDGLVLTVLADRLPTIAATDPAIAAFLADSRLLAASADDADFWRMAEIGNCIHEELHGRATGRELLLDAMVTEVLMRLGRKGAERANSAEIPALKMRDHDRANMLETLVAAHCREHRPVSFYAQKLGISPAHLNRIARRETGASVQQLSARSLLRAARRDLIFTPSSVQAIAYSLGFQDPAYFHRFFKHRVGMTPLAYRAEERRKLVE